MNPKIFSPNKTSAKFLLDCAREKFFNKSELTTDEESRFAIMFDLFIKARSWGIMNKICFCLDVMLAMMVVLWPFIVIISKDFGLDKEFLKSPVAQTTIIGLAALISVAYNLYKNRQSSVENLMRFVLFSPEPFFELKDKVIREMARIDVGFVGFSRTVIDSGKSKMEQN
jgi:hypothetical protein